MRTTLTLEDDVAARIRQEMRRTGGGPKRVVNDALRRGLGLVAAPSKGSRFVVTPHSFGLAAGVDRDRLNQLADQLEAEAAVERSRR